MTPVDPQSTPVRRKTGPLQMLGASALLAFGAALGLGEKRERAPAPPPSPAPPPQPARPAGPVYRPKRPVDAGGWLLLAVVFATGVGGAWYLHAHEQVVKVPRHEIAPYTLLQPGDFTTKRLPRASVTDDAGVDADIADHYTLTRLEADRPVPKSALEEAKGLEAGRFTIVSVKTSRSNALGGEIKAGDRIDIDLGELPPSAGLKSVFVLDARPATETSPGEGGSDSEGKPDAKTESEGADPSMTLVLAVPAARAERFAADAGAHTVEVTRPL